MIIYTLNKNNNPSVVFEDEPPVVTKDNKVVFKGINGQGPYAFGKWCKACGEFLQAISTELEYETISAQFRSREIVSTSESIVDHGFEMAVLGSKMEAFNLFCEILVDYMQRVSDTVKSDIDAVDEANKIWG